MVTVLLSFPKMFSDLPKSILISMSYIQIVICKINAFKREQVEMKMFVVWCKKCRSKIKYK